jgi:NAD(P)-dependent dehydrogenase (short-subunit alcohol dehydrogenase family)
MEFQDKVVVVTGASSGIGRSVAVRFLNEGATVVAVARRKEALQRLADKAALDRLIPAHADLMQADQRVRLAEGILTKFPELDVLVHAAGIIASGTVETTRLEDWQSMMNINLDAVFHLTQLCLPALEKRKGNIVNISSVAGLRSFPGVFAYSVSKAALDQFTRCTALELAPKGIRVNAVNPGVVITELHRSGGMSEEQYQAFLERSKTTHPLGRVGTADEIAELVLFLASDRASWITGVTCSIDGGRALTCAR